MTNKKEIILAKGLTFPLNVPFSLHKNNDSITISSNGFKFPLSLPFTLSESKVIDTPSTNKKGGLSLPFCVPFSLSINEESEEGSNGRRKITTRYNVSEKAWVFQGIVFDENVIAHMKSQVLLLEEVKGRILVDMVLVDKNHIKLKWYGSKVETVQVFKKLDIDEKYEADGDPVAWDVGETTITVSDSSYNIILKGPSGSGESGVINLSDTNSDVVKHDLKIALNEKTYFLTVDFKETHKLNINF